jgi:hypothetical protein
MFNHDLPRPSPARAELPCDLDVVCEAAVAALRARGLALAVQYEGHGEPRGEWDPERLAAAIVCLLSLAAAGAPRGARLRLRWRGDADEVAIRVEAPHRRGPLRMEFDWGGAPEDGPDARVAHRVALAHGGMLARFTTSRATTWVLVLPRRAPGSPHHAAA